ncbi:MAG: MBL fold metallo-hydrolase [Candidatus Nitronauta litoralis]|uniref:MBL fold metallo-hydrolase n=1 Tax=Candidatus Nitronauta litoralis TaxID=2705533 RepID=A0A7T0BT53_9BACT|nr:MAG: MBL fold metallo-hydrolase [Candidatus Nitronauta litoralis]
MTLSLEDEFGDLLQKARDGKAMSQRDLARAAGIPESEIDRMERYELTPRDDQIVELAKVLDLDATALKIIAREQWVPKTPVVDPSFELTCMEVFMGAYPVKCYLVTCPKTKESVVIDTGANPETIIKTVREKNVNVSRILLTHNHPDHAWGLGELDKAFECPTWIGKMEPKPRGSRDLRVIKDEGELILGQLIIETLNTPGHTPGGVSYKIHNTVFSGDCIFAGSMGRANSSWRDLYDSITEKLLSLPDRTVLHPGHGPATTVGEENRHNPFFCHRN